jgi:hypothetical protein
LSRAEALAVLSRLAHGLGPDEAGVERLLERISSDDAASMLRDALIEAGAFALLRERRPVSIPAKSNEIQGVSFPWLRVPEEERCSRRASRAIQAEGGRVP